MTKELKGQEAKNHYKKLWKSEIKSLTGLGWHLPEDSDREKLANLQKQLEELVDKAVENVHELKTYSL